jgi:hypothetical protein
MGWIGDTDPKMANLYIKSGEGRDRRIADLIDTRTAPGPKKKGRPGSYPTDGLVNSIAGAGFEPATFGL